MTSQLMPRADQGAASEMAGPSQGQDGAISVALYLRRHHDWSRWMLSLDGIYARVGRRHGRWCLEPHRRLFRWITRKRLPLDRAFPPGLRIRFLPSLKWRSSGSSVGLGVLALILGGLGYARNVLDTSELEGWIESSLPSKPLSSFPVGEWVEIKTYAHEGDMSVWVEDSARTSWKLSGLALTSVTDIEVDTNSILTAWKNIRE